MIGSVIRNIIWPLMAWKGNKTKSYLLHFQQTEHMSPDELHRMRSRRLKEMIEHAVTHVPAYFPYRDEAILRLNKGDEPEEVLQCIPILTKPHFMEHSKDYLSTDSVKETLIANRSGGSTGQAVQFYLDRVTVEHFEAARWRGLSWHGIRIGDPSVMIWGSPIELTAAQTRQYERKERLLKNRIIIPAYELAPDKIEQYFAKLTRFKPDYLYGYASALTLFAELMLERGLVYPDSLKAVVSTAETLHDHQREVIHRAFGCKVVNEYGARDGGMIAYECPMGGMHLAAENAWFEVVDMQTGKPLSPGEKGLLLITDLNNQSMPRLRYQVGDVAALSDEPCSCGLKLPLLQSIEGREDDTFVTANGTLIHGHYVNHIMRNLSSFDGFQVIQHSPVSLTVKLAKNEERYKQEEERIFIDGLRNAFGEIAQINVKYVDHIAPTASGKMRYAIREFPLRGSDDA